MAAWIGNEELWTCTSALSRYMGGTDRRQAALSEKSRMTRYWMVISRAKREVTEVSPYFPDSMGTGTSQAGQTIYRYAFSSCVLVPGRHAPVK
jgi:hypothetical protein